jgi:hypothetical protein
LPVLFAATKADSVDDKAENALVELQEIERQDWRSRNIDPESVVLRSALVSAARNVNLDAARNGIRDRINWSLQPELSREAFLRARERIERVIQPANTILPLPVWDSAWRTEADWIMPILPAVGIRRFPDSNIAIEDPRQFEQLILDITDIVRREGAGVPACPLSVLEDRVLKRVLLEKWPGSEARSLSDDLTRAVTGMTRDLTGELVRIGEASQIDSDNGPVIVMPRWLGSAPLGGADERRNLVLRAQWQEPGLSMLARLAAKFAFSHSHSLQDAGWEHADRQGRILATVATGIPLSIDITEDGPSVTFTAQVPARLRRDDASRAADLLREWLEQLSPRGLDISTLEFQGQSDYEPAF